MAEHESKQGRDVEAEAAPVLEPATQAPPIPYSIFTSRHKALIVAIVAMAATFSGFASNIYFPAIPRIASTKVLLLLERSRLTLLLADLGVTAELINLTVTSYMVLQGLSPSIWGAIADVRGRRVTYIGTFLVFISACVGLAETKHYYQLVILRCLQSAGSASTIAIGAGVIGDITTREERGGYMGIFQAGLLSPVAIGPVLGGVFAQTLGWRAIFWFLTIYGGVFLIFLVIVLPETLRTMVGNGSKPAKGLSNSLLASIQRRRHPPDFSIELERSPTTASMRKKLPIDVLGPIKIIFTREVTFAIIFLSIYYTVWQMTISILSTLFSRIYNLTEIQIGLTYIGNGAGSVLGTLTTGYFLDYDYGKFKASFQGPAEDFPLERARLRTLYLWSGLEIAAALVFGWTLEYKVHIAVPIICTFVLGWTATSIISVVNTFLVDIFPKKGASATAALNLLRCLVGAGGTAAVLPIVNAVGVGWTFTLAAGLLFLSVGMVVVQMVKGPGWRAERRMLEENL